MIELFRSYDWPGNVRELRNTVIRGAALQSSSGTNLSDLLLDGQRNKKVPHVPETLIAQRYAQARDIVVTEFERAYFTEVVRHSGFNLQAASRHSGLSTQSLYRLLQKHGIQLKKMKKANIYALIALR